MRPCHCPSQHLHRATLAACRVEGREIIANLSKAAGLATMIAAMRPDIDNIDEYVRNTTARAFSVVASALGIPALLPFLKAVCMSKKSWQARPTGIKLVQQIAILLGCAVLPHLKVSGPESACLLLHHHCTMGQPAVCEGSPGSGRIFQVFQLGADLHCTAIPARHGLTPSFHSSPLPHMNSALEFRSMLCCSLWLISSAMD